MPKKGEYVRFKKFERKIKSWFMSYADFESILLPEVKWKQNLDESYTNKYQKHLPCSYGCELVHVDDKLSKPFNPNLGEDAVYNFINSMVREKRYCSNLIKKQFNKELAMTEKDAEDFESST